MTNQKLNLNARGVIGYSTGFIYRLLMILILVGGTVLIVVTHFSKPVDLRQIEAQEIGKITFDCIRAQGIDAIAEDSLESCFNYDKSENGIKISYGDNSISLGKPLIITLCETGKDVDTKVGCYSGNYSLNKNNQLIKINILVGIAKANKNS